ncbi:MAG: glycosyltransferase [Candidatus Jordarchaeum sp.]|uniref:glycosyltransferase n=1 Tax=Candidatus Jordarchaeum sp. TaxID=2823881 RepID=UPI00404AADA6
MIAPDYPSEQRPASGVFFREQAQAISVYDDITVFCFYSGSKKVFDVLKLYKVKKNIENTIPTVRFEYPKIWNKIDGINYLIAAIYSIILAEQRGPFELIHAQKFFPSAVIGSIIKKRFGGRLVITEHAGDFRNSMRSVLRRICIKRAIKSSDQVIAVSKFLANSIKEYWPNIRLKIVPNPVNIEKFCIDGPQNKYKEKKKILHISDMSINKGIRNIIEAGKRLREKRSDFIIIMIGGKSKDIERWHNYINIGLDFIEFAGEMRHEQVASHLKLCDFFVLPSLRESFGSVLIEAMACGKPVVATKCGGPEEIVTSDTGILIPPNDVDSLTGSLDYMLDNYWQFDPEKIAKFAEENFSYENVGQKLHNIYKESLFNDEFCLDLKKY